ncbi:glucose dehydrogenase [Roseicyclus sp. F158]|uniref:Glucose dehydrogenase n=1 Tax=Tropicimonas omnivorans TaxID=3075590 RepID=A0ABU3DE14_9RHOB|nr:glucose dehydrogenase [Roseicyclus sp. F158]MDT0681965.1 glucose dehydrogenase [Roseicyclus sp. F158]
MTHSIYNEGTHFEERRHTHWAAVFIGVLCALLGIVLFAGGVWLAMLGGSWYYALAGIGLLLTGWFLARGLMSGVYVYLVTWAGTLIWAYWEVGTDWWAQVPRIVAPTVILILVLLLIPVLRHRRR